MSQPPHTCPAPPCPIPPPRRAGTPGSTPTSTTRCASCKPWCRVPTDTPPGNKRAACPSARPELLAGMGLVAEQHPVPAEQVHAAGLQSLTNLIVRRRRFGEGGLTLALNAHGDVVPPGDGWSHDPLWRRGGERPALRPCLGGEQERFRQLHLCAARAGSRWPGRHTARWELHFTYDEEFGGELGPGWLLSQGLTAPDLLIAAGFSYQVVTAHNGCLQLEVTIHGLASHAAYPHTGVDALQGRH